MIWGKTFEQRQQQERQGYSRFAWLPTQLYDGRWVWLQTYWTMQYRVIRDNQEISYSPTGDMIKALSFEEVTSAATGILPKRYNSKNL